MSARVAAVALAGVVVVLAGGAGALQATGAASPETDSELIAALWSVAFVVFALVGALLVWRRPAHPVGWLLAAVGVLMHVDNAAFTYAALGETPYDVPGGAVAEWLGYTLWPATVTVLVILLLVFPTGRPASDQWRRYAWVFALAGGVLLVANAAEAWAARGSLQVADPNPFTGILGMAMQALAVFVVGGMAVAAVGLVLRYRAARGLERQQLKLLAVAMVVLVVGVASGILVDVLGWGVDAVTALLYLVGLAGIPVAIGIAVLRYRLYEIDRLVSRTVSYALVIVILAGVYVTGVVGVGYIIRTLFGATGGDLLVAASTLAVAAAFGPVRARVQRAVDRRFNRARYDAQRTVEDFAQRLRDEVDLAAFVADLGGTAATALQPRSVHVWVPDQSWEEPRS